MAKVGSSPTKEDWLSFKIRLCNGDDLFPFSSHCIAHFREKSVDGGFSHPFPHDHPWSLKDFAEGVQFRWTRKPFSPQWEIAWVATVKEKIVGHLVLRSGSIEAEVHRMKLGMGIENNFRSLGIGSALLERSLTWARTHSEISWIDLSVFVTNRAARNLYKKFDFTEICRVEDALRVNGQKIDDVQMTLKLR